VPFLAAAPMLVLATATSLYLVGVDSMRAWPSGTPRIPARTTAPVAARPRHQTSPSSSKVYRYKFNHDANERRRIRMAVYTAVPGVFAYALKDGVPIVAMLMGRRTRPIPGSSRVPAGAGAVAGVRPDLRRRRGARARPGAGRPAQHPVRAREPRARRDRDLPGAALVYALLQKNLWQIVTSGSVVYLLLFAAALGVARYRVRARQWLDQRFFREEYDARKILVSLAGRVRFETDPGDLAALVVEQIDKALHPRSRPCSRAASRTAARAGHDAKRHGGAARARRRPGDDAAVVGSAAGDFFWTIRAPPRAACTGGD